MNIQIERATEALDQRHRAGAGRLAGAAGPPNQVTGDHPVDDALYSAHRLRAAGKQQAQRIWEAQDRLAHRLLWKDPVHQQGRGFGPAPRAAAGTEAATLAAQGDQALGAAVLAAHAQEAMLQAAAAQVVVELADDVVR